MQYCELEDNSYEDGKILSEEELVLRLRDRPDIFTLHSEKRLFLFVLVSIFLGLFTGEWLKTITGAEVNSEFQERSPVRRAVELNKKKYLSPDLKNRVLSETETASMYLEWPNTVQRTMQSVDKKTDQKNPERVSHSDLKSEKHADLSTVTTSIVSQSVAKTTIVKDSALKRDTLSSKKIENVVKDNSETPDNQPIDQKSLYKLNDHAKAFASLQNALKRNPRDTSALSGMGFMFLQVGLLDSALSYYKSSLAVNPKSSSAHKGLATARYYLTTLASNPNYARINKIADTAQFIRSQFDSAIIEYTNAIALDSTNVDALSNRGVLRYIHNDLAGAVKDYSLAIKINPTWADAYSKRGAVYKTMGKYRDAIDDYTSAIKLDSGSYDFNGALRFANAYFGRGVLYSKMSKYDLAIRDFDSTIILSPGHSLAILNRAVALLDSKRYKEALDGFTQAIKTLSPMEYDGAQYFAYLQRGNAFKALGQFDKAIEDYKSSSGFPKLAGKACWRIAQCCCLEKEDDTAIAWLKKSVLNGFNNVKIWEKDKELESLWSKDEFRKIVGD